MGDSDLIKLYSGRILTLAADIPNAELLEAPHGSAKRRSPQCGSSITVDLCIENGRVSDFGQDVRACALGQASASILGAQIIGCDYTTLKQGRDALWDMLTKNGPLPAAPFEELEVLSAARDFTNRHGSIMLGFEAALDAFQAATDQACA